MNNKKPLRIDARRVKLTQTELEQRQFMTNHTKCATNYLIQLGRVHLTITRGRKYRNSAKRKIFEVIDSLGQFYPSARPDGLKM